METTKETRHRSSYLLRVFNGDYNPFTPNIILINDHFIEYRRRNWYLISVDTQNFHFQNVIGVDVDKHLFGATLRIVTSGKYDVMIHGLTKKNADKIKAWCAQFIAKNTQRGVLEATAQTNRSLSTADEIKKLKGLLDEGLITNEEFQTQKQKLMK